MKDRKIQQLFSFLNETIEYFLSRAENVDRDRYYADRDRMIDFDEQSMHYALVG